MAPNQLIKKFTENERKLIILLNYQVHFNQSKQIEKVIQI